ncbi:hypothetical protein ACH4E7_41500 [Kitasatospora sp. NPDC018058]|uniref:hypothetical protein n=1 Tax=Kitasatospora sp. NPDC018058 TaxID=3364025 RepID=UPI0037C131D8
MNRVLCAYIQLNPDERTFTITSEGRPTFDLAAAWLIARGADPAAFRLDIGEPGGSAACPTPWFQWEFC